MLLLRTVLPVFCVPSEERGLESLFQRAQVLGQHQSHKATVREFTSKEGMHMLQFVSERTAGRNLWWIYYSPQKKLCTEVASINCSRQRESMPFLSS